VEGNGKSLTSLITLTAGLSATGRETRSPSAPRALSGAEAITAAACRTAACAHDPPRATVTTVDSNHVGEQPAPGDGREAKFVADQRKKMRTKNRVLNSNQIETYAHCALCLDELPADTSPREYVRVEFGWTKFGLQVWCIRHDCNIVNIDFEGHKHPANTTRRRPSAEVVPLAARPPKEP
jgi:hypothetical protein